MSVAILIITHDSIGQSILDAAANVLGVCPVKTRVISFHKHSNPESVYDQAKSVCQDMDDGDGVLILTDLFGSTPSNIAVKLLKQINNYCLITGINLQMLIRIMNYPQLNLKKLAEKATSGAREGIFIVDPQ